MNMRLLPNCNCLVCQTLRAEIMRREADAARLVWLEQELVKSRAETEQALDEMRRWRAEATRERAERKGEEARAAKYAGEIEKLRARLATPEKP